MAQEPNTFGAFPPQRLPQQKIDWLALLSQASAATQPRLLSNQYIIQPGFASFLGNLGKAYALQTLEQKDARKKAIEDTQAWIYSIPNYKDRADWAAHYSRLHRYNYQVGPKPRAQRELEETITALPLLEPETQAGATPQPQMPSSVPRMTPEISPLIGYEMAKKYPLVNILAQRAGEAWAVPQAEIEVLRADEETQKAVKALEEAGLPREVAAISVRAPQAAAAYLNKEIVKQRAQYDSDRIAKLAEFSRTVNSAIADKSPQEALDIITTLMQDDPESAGAWYDSVGRVLIGTLNDKLEKMGRAELQAKASLQEKAQQLYDNYWRNVDVNKMRMVEYDARVDAYKNEAQDAGVGDILIPPPPKAVFLPNYKQLADAIPGLSDDVRNMLRTQPPIELYETHGLRDAWDVLRYDREYRGQAKVEEQIALSQHRRAIGDTTAAPYQEHPLTPDQGTLQPMPPHWFTGRALPPPPVPPVRSRSALRRAPSTTLPSVGLTSKVVGRAIDKAIAASRDAGAPVTRLPSYYGLPQGTVDIIPSTRDEKGMRGLQAAIATWQQLGGIVVGAKTRPDGTRAVRLTFNTAQASDIARAAEMLGLTTPPEAARSQKEKEREKQRINAAMKAWWKVAEEYEKGSLESFASKAMRIPELQAIRNNPKARHGWDARFVQTMKQVRKNVPLKDLRAFHFPEACNTKRDIEIFETLRRVATTQRNRPESVEAWLRVGPKVKNVAGWVEIYKEMLQRHAK